MVDGPLTPTVDFILMLIQCFEPSVDACGTMSALCLVLIIMFALMLGL